MASLFLEGLLLQASLIFALGAQNLFVLDAGLNRNHPMVVSFVCFLCDLTLIMLGVAGAASIFNQYPALKIVIGVLGVVFLFQYGLEKVFAIQKLPDAKTPQLQKNLKKVIILSMTFSILNPHAYLDAFILIGGVSTKYSLLSDRIIFGLGAACFSGIWFVFLSSMASALKPILESPAKLRFTMSAAGLALIVLSGMLGVEVYTWIGPIGEKIVLKTLIDYPSSASHVFTAIGI